jgi:predicted PurR-regulated permease PerM
VVVQNTSTQKSLQVGVGILAAAAAIALLYYGRVFLITVIIASMIAFLLDPLVVFFVKLRMPRGLASFVVCSIALVVLYLAGLGVYLQGQQIAADLPAYGTRISEMVDSVAGRMETFENGIYRSLVPRRFQPQSDTVPPVPIDTPLRGKKKKAEPPPPMQPPAVQEVHIQQEPTPLFAYAYTYLAEYYSVLLMASFVPFLVYFLLSWRDYIRARYLLLFEGENRNAAAATWKGLGDMVRAYVIGNFMLGILLSVASALLFASVKLPYWLIIAPVSGFLSLVPYIGLPLALIPPVVRRCLLRRNQPCTCSSRSAWRCCTCWL